MRIEPCEHKIQFIAINNLIYFVYCESAYLINLVWSLVINKSLTLLYTVVLTTNYYFFSIGSIESFGTSVLCNVEFRLRLLGGIRYFSFPRYWMNQFKQTDAGNLL